MEPVIDLKCGHTIDGWGARVAFGHHSRFWCEKCGNYSDRKAREKSEPLPIDPMF